ncbi:MAG: 30S ribosomal protein S6--L-glutamate ligase, partial [Bacteroidota bacterium]
HDEHKMKILILSRSAQLYSTQRLFNAGKERGHDMSIVDHTCCSLVMQKGELEVYHKGEQLKEVDAIIPRIGSSVTFQGASIIQQFELMKVFTVARSYALLQARDKLRCLQKLASYGLDIPTTFYLNSSDNLEDIYPHVGGFPLIIKLTESTHGTGVYLAESLYKGKKIIESLLHIKERVLIQEYIKESSGTDLRVLVVAGKVVAAMERKSASGDFRSNLHRGGTSNVIKLSKSEIELAVRAAQIMGLDVAGVDVLRSERGPLVLEVNASPGLEGIEKTTNVDVAGKVIELIERKCSYPSQITF